MKAFRLITLVLSLFIFTALCAQSTIYFASTDPAIPAGNVMAGTPDHVIYRFTLQAVNGDALFTTLNFATMGSYEAGDVNDLKLWFSTVDDFATATDLDQAFTLNFGAGAQNFNSINFTLIDGTMYYFWITANILHSAVQGHTICVAGLTPICFNFNGVTEELGLAYDGGCQTFEGVLPVELSSFTAIATAQNFVALRWTSQTETNLSGYYIYRNTISELASGIVVSPLISPTNTSQATDYTFTDEEVLTGNTYYYWLQSLDMSGEFNFYGPLNVTLTEGGGSTIPEIPTDTQLLDAYPNPFKPTTNLTYSLKAAGTVKIEVFNLKGQLIWSSTQSHLNAGYFYATWNGKDLNENPVSSGLYYYKMTSDKYSATKKVVLVK